MVSDKEELIGALFQLMRKFGVSHVKLVEGDLSVDAELGQDPRLALQDGTLNDPDLYGAVQS